MRRKTKRLIIVISLIVVIFLLMIGLYFYGLTSVKKKSDTVKFTIESGTGTKQIIDNLSDNNIIKSKISGYIYIKLHSGIIFKAGEYELDRSYSAKEIFDILNNGARKESISVKFIEGKRITDYAKVINDNFGYSEEEFYNVLKDQDYLKTLINKYEFLDDKILNSDIYYSLEGYLFPDTYDFYKDASIKDIIEKMLDKTGKILDNYDILLKKSGYSVHEILTIASIIENETKYDEDRSIASEVIYKRLDSNMSLGMDVTTYYAEQKSFKESLTKEELNKLNAYNTRNTSFKGLPVGPISNPSEKSIEAALKPSDDNYLYFYADVKTGKLYFAETESEFNELIRKYS